MDSHGNLEMVGGIFAEHTETGHFCLGLSAQRKLCQDISWQQLLHDLLHVTVQPSFCGTLQVGGALPCEQKARREYSVEDRTIQRYVVLRFYKPTRAIDELDKLEENI